MTPEVDSARVITFAVNHYTYRLEWSSQYDDYIGSCLELPFLWRQAPTPQQAITEVQTAVDEHVEGLQNRGETPPPPLTERVYSGTFLVRTSPELHGRLAREAAAEGVSMNQWVVQRLAGRRASEFFGLSGFD